MTPHSVHHGHAGAMLVTRQATLDAAFLVHPNRFNPGGHPKCPTYGHPNCSTLAAVI
jgi:hypothetical protein